MANQIPIPRYIWDSLEAAIQAESRRLVRDIAQTLGKPDGPLWNEVKKNSVSAYLVDLQEPTNEEFKCQAYTTNTLVQRPCGMPVIFGKKSCPEHCNTLHVKPDTSLPKYKVLHYEDDEGNLVKAYLRESDVLHVDTLEKIGTWNAESKTLSLFEKPKEPTKN